MRGRLALGRGLSRFCFAAYCMLHRIAVMIAYPIMATHAMLVLDSCESMEIARRANCQCSCGLPFRRSSLRKVSPVHEYKSPADLERHAPVNLSA